jgi:hypothetical protein
MENPIVFDAYPILSVKTITDSSTVFSTTKANPHSYCQTRSGIDSGAMIAMTPVSLQMPESGVEQSRSRR